MIIWLASNMNIILTYIWVKMDPRKDVGLYFGKLTKEKCIVEKGKEIQNKNTLNNEK